MTTVAQRLALALTAIGASGAADQARTDQVDKGLGGSTPASEGGGAPGVVRQIADHVKAAPLYFGKSNLVEVLGVGEAPKDGPIPEGVHVSINLRDKSLFPHVAVEVKEAILHLKKMIHNSIIKHRITCQTQGFPTPLTDSPYFQKMVVPLLKAFDLATFTNFLPTLNTAFWYEEMEIPPGIEQYFSTYDMASRTVQVPGLTGRMIAKLEGDTATFDEQDQGQDAFSMTAQDAVVHTKITEDLLQDMIPNAGGFERLRREAAMGVARAKERAIIDGDDTNSGSGQGSGHMDSDVAAISKDFRKAFKGLRKRALAAGNTYDNASDGFGLATIEGMVQVLGKHAVEKGLLQGILGSSLNHKIVFGGIPEILTKDKAQEVATLFNGKMPPLFGIPFHTSEWMREDLNASGVYAASQVLTTVLLFRKDRFVFGARAPLKLWATPSLADSDKMYLAAKERFTFGGIPQSSTEKSVAIAIGVRRT